MPDDRDQLFEKALARQLRADAAAESLCPDPETLAAYHERNLSPEELSAAKSHIVSCARCQEILAQLQTTEALAEAVGDPRAAPETVPPLATVKPAPVLIHEEALAAAASARAATPRKPTSIATRRWSPLRWAVPAGAVAAGILLLIGLRESRVAAPKQQLPSQVAENRALPPVPQQTSDALSAVEQDKQEPQHEKGSLQQFQKSVPSAAPMSRGENVARDEKKDFPAGSSLSEAPQLSAKVLRSPAPIPRRRAAGPNVTSGQAQAADAIQQSAPINGRADQQVELAPKAVAPQPPALDDGAARTRAKAGVGGGQGAGNGPAPPPASSSLPPPAALKQTPGLLRGTVTDPSGAAIAGANVVLKSPGGGTIASTSSDSGGAYSFDGVSAGSYQLELQSPGFKTDTLSGLNVAPGENVVNARLEIGASSETVEVTGQATVLNSQAAEVNAAPERKRKAFQALLLASPGLQTLTSPDGKVIWKFGEMGQIFHSGNAGKDWSSEASGVTVKLLAASSPNAKVCWIAGAAGTLLRTADGGKHWQRITTPITGDLGGVHAADAQHASIWDAPNHLSYDTSDGGATWKPSANE